MLMVLMLVFDGGIHNYPEFQIILFRTEIGVNYLFAVDGDMICISWLIGQPHDRALIAKIAAGSRWCRDGILQMCPVR